MLAQYIREKGMRQGMRQGIIQNAKENIIEVLELRFEKISPEIIDKINQINDPAFSSHSFSQMLKNAFTLRISIPS